jgi:LAO/AO transport system kinase
MNVADKVVLVLGPSWGDEVQAEKAGVLEISDLIVVNKADRPGAEDVRRALLEAGTDREVIMTSATTGEGVETLLTAVDRLSAP